MSAVDKLLKGYQDYRDGSYERPEVAVIACSDSRVDPAILFQADPGDLFVIRNVANLVPPMELEGTYHGTSAALEFAILGLNVKHLVVLGHAHCGGIKLMMDPDRRVLATMSTAGEEACTRACEQNAVLVSLENLTTFPWVRERVESGALKLHGWYVDIAGPELSGYDWEAGKFTTFT
jgi:carbonic anhydrase